MSTSPRLNLRRGVTEPVMLVISCRQVENIDITSVLTELKPFLSFEQITSRQVDGTIHEKMVLSEKTLDKYQAYRN